MRVDTVIIGGGLFGKVIAKALTSVGHETVVVDAQKDDAGSRPAACLMKPSWFSGLGKEIYEPSLRLLGEVYAVKDIDFRVGPATATVHWIRPRDILSYPHTYARVTHIEPGLVTALDARAVMQQWRTRNIIVAAGVWSNRILNLIGKYVPNLTGRAGTAWLWPNLTVDEPFVRPWAPYRQLVAFNRGDGLWMGDGTSIKTGNWTREHDKRSLSRCIDALPQTVPRSSYNPVMERLHGIRPYIPKVKHAVLEDLGGGIWVATGGAKNGTIGAGWCAHQLRDALT